MPIPLFQPVNASALHEFFRKGGFIPLYLSFSYNRALTSIGTYDSNRADLTVLYIKSGFLPYPKH
jgi:hypothetical protein